MTEDPSLFLVAVEVPDLADMFHWTVWMDPPPGHPCIGPFGNRFHGVRIAMALTFPSDYPFKPFKCQLLGVVQPRSPPPKAHCGIGVELEEFQRRKRLAME